MSILYIHSATCISPQQTFEEIDLERLNKPVGNKLEVIEPTYKTIPAGALRRMGKAIRMGLGAALPLINNQKPNGIIIGTANGGMEDCIKFLNQIIEYDEGRLTPGNFVGSTPNAIAGQLGMINSNHQYNITHVQSGLSFENALLDAVMLLQEENENHYLVGAVDEISDYNYNIDWLAGWYKREDFSSPDFYEARSIGSIAGEGAAMFLTNANKKNALAGIQGIHMFHAEEESVIKNELALFLEKCLPEGEKIDLFLTGENGDSRFVSYYRACESLFTDHTTVARYKHFTGEYPTSSAIALWLTCQFISTQSIPTHFIKKAGTNAGYKNVLIYNHYKGRQQGFMLVATAGKD